jgi:hypothetical protein
MKVLNRHRVQDEQDPFVAFYAYHPVLKNAARILSEFYESACYAVIHPKTVRKVASQLEAMLNQPEKASLGRLTQALVPVAMFCRKHGLPLPQVRLEL